MGFIRRLGQLSLLDTQSDTQTEEWREEKIRNGFMVLLIRGC